MGLFSGILNAVESVAKPIADFITPGLGSALGAVGSFLGTQSANQANQQMAATQTAVQQASTKEQMDFQREMSNTSYQRAIVDMKAAGLNPMLAYSQGGASTPSGSSVSGSSAHMENVLGNATNAAFSGANMVQQLRNMSETEKNIVANTESTEANAANTRADTVNKLLTAPNISLENKRMLADIAVKNTSADLNSAVSHNTKKLLAPSNAPWARGIDLGASFVNSAKDSVKTNPFMNENTRNFLQGK